MKNNVIPVVLASNNNYAKYMYVTVLSILENKNEDTCYDFYFLIAGDYTKDNIERFNHLKDKYSNCSINFVSMKDDFNSQAINFQHLATPAFYRLKIADILEKYNKALYFDTDVIVLKDLSEFYNIDLEDNYIGGIKAAVYILKQGPEKEYYDDNGLKDLSQYINSGITLWNLEKIRKENKTRYMCELSENNYKSHDQDVINIAFYNQIKHLPVKYNLMTKYLPFSPKNKKYKYDKLKEIYGEANMKEALKDPVAIHYADNLKPWNCCFTKLSKYWWKYAKLSPQYFELLKDFIKSSMKYIFVDSKFWQYIFSVTNIKGNYKLLTIFCFEFRLEKSNKIKGFDMYNHWWEKIFSIRNNVKTKHKIVTIAGIKLKFRHEKKRVFNSAEYWEARYKRGGNSGAGSYTNLAEFKAKIINEFVSENNVKSVIEFGFGDGNQLQLFNFEKYLGFDVSATILESTQEKFKDKPNYEFKLVSDYKNQTADLVMSLDVIFHLVEDDVYKKYMNNLFKASSKYVIIYSSNEEKEAVRHVRQRKFTDYVEKHFPNFKLIKMIKNEYPYDIENPNHTSFADFYIYEKQ